MRLEYKYGLLLALVVGLIGPTAGWSADEPVLTPPKEISPVDRVSPVSTVAASGIEPASYAPRSRLHDNVVDDCEDAAPPGFGRCILQTPGKIWQSTQKAHQCWQRKRECVKWWFGYIKGNGPAVWDREY